MSKIESDALAILKQILYDYEEFAETGDGNLFDERLMASVEGARAAGIEIVQR